MISRRLSYILNMTMMTMLVMVVSCSKKESFVSTEGVVWNTVYHITYNGDPALQDSILPIFNRIESSLSPFKEGSLISNINSNRSDKVDDYIIKVFEESQRINKVSGGMFDPTVAPLIRAWGFGQGHEVNADTLHIDSLLNLVGIQKASIADGKMVKSSPSMEFNFSAIAKGFGVDCIADMFLRNGVEDFMIEIGGEIRVAGKSPDGNFWRIGIDTPDETSPSTDLMYTVTLRDGGLATSGNYRNFHEVDGRRFGHTISPETGRPVLTDILSATVIAPTCMEADAIATTCMAIGSERSIALCDSLRLGVLLILSDYTLLRNPLFP